MADTPGLFILTDKRRSGEGAREHLVRNEADRAKAEIRLLRYVIERAYGCAADRIIERTRARMHDGSP